MRARAVLAAAFVLGLVLTLSAPFGSRAAGAPMTKIVVAQGFIAQFAVGVWIAGAHDIFARNGLDVDVTVVNSTQAMQALVGGSVHIMLGSPGQGLSANAGGAAVVEIATLAPRMAYRFVGRGSGGRRTSRARSWARRALGSLPTAPRWSSTCGPPA